MSKQKLTAKPPASVRVDCLECGAEYLIAILYAPAFRDLEPRCPYCNGGNEVHVGPYTLRLVSLPNVSSLSGEGIQIGEGVHNRDDFEHAVIRWEDLNSEIPEDSEVIEPLIAEFLARRK